MNNINIIKFLNNKNIDIEIKKNKKDNKEGSIENRVNKHLNILKEFHKKCINSKDFCSLGLSSGIWHDIEELKVWNKRAKKIINDKDERVKYIKESEKCINQIYKIDYIKLIERAMKRKEICVGKPYESNFWKESNLKISDISKMNFNMIEMDYYRYLSKLKKREIDLPWDDIITNIIVIEELDKKSYVFLKSLIDYPYEPMKILQKEYLDNIKKIYIEK